MMAGLSPYERDKRKPEKNWKHGPKITMDDLLHCRNGVSRMKPGELHGDSKFRPIVIPPKKPRVDVIDDDDPLGMCS